MNGWVRCPFVHREHNERGRPRRVQGTVIGGDDHSRTLIVDAGMPIHCTMTDPRQIPSMFPQGSLVSFDVLDGATFSAE